MVMPGPPTKLPVPSLANSGILAHLANVCCLDQVGVVERGIRLDHCGQVPEAYWPLLPTDDQAALTPRICQALLQWYMAGPTAETLTV